MGNTTSGKRHNSGDDAGPTITANRLGDISLEDDFAPSLFKVSSNFKFLCIVTRIFITFIFIYLGVQFDSLHLSCFFSVVEAWVSCLFLLTQCFAFTVHKAYFNIYFLLRLFMTYARYKHKYTILTL